MIKMYGLKQCSTCQKAKQWFEDQGIVIDSLIDIKSQSPSKEELSLAIRQYGDQPRKIMNSSGQLYRSMNMKEKLDQMNQADLIDLLAKEGMLVKRPFVTDSDRVSVGAKVDDLEDIWL